MEQVNSQNIESLSDIAGFRKMMIRSKPAAEMSLRPSMGSWAKRMLR